MLALLLRLEEIELLPLLQLLAAAEALEDREPLPEPELLLLPENCAEVDVLGELLLQLLADALGQALELAAAEALLLTLLLEVQLEDAEELQLLAQLRLF